MYHFKAFDMMNLQYEIKIWKKMLNKAKNDKKQHPPPLLSTLRLFLILFGNFFPNETLTGCPFFSLTFGIGEHRKHCSMSFLHSSTRNDMVQCFACSPIPEVSEKKGKPVRVSFGKKLPLAELVLQCRTWDHAQVQDN